MRTVLRSRDEVAHFWANKVQPEGRAGNVFFVGNTIYSYGDHFPVATHYHGGVAFTSRRYSVTTNSHKALILRAIPASTVVVRVPFPTSPASVQMDIVRREIERLLDKASRARKNKAVLMSQAAEMAADFNTFAEWRGETCRIAVAQDLDAFRAEIAEAERAEEERLARKAAEQEAKDAQAIAEWLAGTRAHCPRTSMPLLRLAGDEVETSWGATVPVSDARSLWQLVQRQRAERQPRDFGGRYKVGHYPLNTIAANGSVVIGCHTIAYSEMQRIANILGLDAVAA